MQDEIEVLPAPIDNRHPKILTLRCPVRCFAIEEVVLANVDEVTKFIMQKR